MPQIVNFRSADDPRDVVHQVVQSLSEGQLVGLPTETGYVAAASPLRPQAVERLARLAERSGHAGLVLALKNPLEALDYLPHLPSLGRKLIRRFWPGPVTLLFDGPVEDGLAGSLPAPVGRALAGESGLALRVPAHEVLSNVLRLLPAPLCINLEARSASSLYPHAPDLARIAGDDLAIIVDSGTCRYDQPTSVVRVGPSRWSLVHEGVASRTTLNRLAGNMYLFVCTGNTCRSPMAEGLFRKLLAERMKCGEDELVDRGYVVASAGVSAAHGSPPSPEAVELLIDRGVDLRGHESQPVTAQLLSQADEVFTMTRSHRDVLVRDFPEMAESVRLLARDGADVIDPLGAGMDEYRRCAAQIELYLKDIMAELPPVNEPSS